MTVMYPLVSCIMPTNSRRAFVSRAIGYFLAQDYPNKELVILDDGADSVADLVPPDPQVRYIRARSGRTLGAKRNDCVAECRGDLILHWDDDDWMAPRRIRYQVEALLAAGAEVCGLRQILYYDLATGQPWLYRYPEGHRPWLAGNTLLYTREFWQRSPFPDVQVASDTHFIWAQPLDRSVALPDYTFYVAMIHSQNTSPKALAHAYWSRWSGDLRQIMGAELDFYHVLVNPGNQISRIDGNPFNTCFAKYFPPPKSVDSAPPVQAEDTPVVSCILATGDRLAFTRQAIRCFLRQTYDQSELIVVDDGAQPVAELCAGLFRVRYVRLEEPTSLGNKLNIGIQHARGSIIQKLDDDDYYHPEFLERAVDSLLTADRECSLVTWDCFLVLLAGHVGVRYSGHSWTAGGTLCFHRQLWERAHFRDLPREVDTWFIHDVQPRIIPVCAPELYILVRHGRNTWNQLSSGEPVNTYFGRLPMYRKPLDDLVEPIDRMFYHSLAEGRPE